MHDLNKMRFGDDVIGARTGWEDIEFWMESVKFWDRTKTHNPAAAANCQHEVDAVLFRGGLTL